MLRPALPLAASLALALLAVSAPLKAQAPRPAPPQGRHCLDESRTRVLLSHTLAGQINPLGSEHHLVLSACKPLFTQPGLLFDYSNVEAGIASYLSPAYTQFGGFVSVTPISLLQLRAELTGVQIWSIPINGAGYFDFPGYGADYSSSAQPSEKGTQAGGAVISLSANLRGQVSLTGSLGLLFTNTFLAEHWWIGQKPYYHNLRRDVILAQSDWVFKNSTALLAEIPITPNLAVRAGLANDLVIVPESGEISDIAGVLGTLMIRRVTESVRNLQPFLRLGIYTPPSFHKGLYLLVGANVLYDLYGNDEPPPPTAPGR